MAKLGMNYSQLSIAAGVSRQTISYINAGKSCKPDVLSKLAKALEVEPEDLIEEVP